MKQPLYQIEFDAGMLLKEHPPQFRHAHKAALFNIAYPDGIAPSSDIEVTRWEQQVDEPLRLPQTLSSTIIPNYYDYQPIGDCSACVEWHVNFADPRLFVAYGSGLFAQDEIQVAEHPLLASIREALLSRLARQHDRRRWPNSNLDSPCGTANLNFDGTRCSSGKAIRSLWQSF